MRFRVAPDSRASTAQPKSRGIARAMALVAKRNPPPHKYAITQQYANSDANYAHFNANTHINGNTYRNANFYPGSASYNSLSHYGRT